MVPNAAPFHNTIEPATKPDPYTVKGNAAEPAATEPGLRPVSQAAAELMVKVAMFDAPPYWLTSWMPAAPAPASRFPGRDAVTVGSDGCVVASGEPFHCTTHPAGQLAPVTVSVKAAEQAVAEGGGIVAIAGAPTMAQDW